ncbi:MAG: NAD(P)H-hydrate dehydratase, partial [Bacteroidia bacterium]|nr:NAD(P)H-hydrate dehydratase [Bacteroidia bacterium]
GLAIARILSISGYNVKAFILSALTKQAYDFNRNLELLREVDKSIVTEINSENDFPFCKNDDLIIDALFGSGLKKPLEGISKSLVNYLNQSEAEIVAIDLPSGLFSDELPDVANPIVKASHTLTFQLPKFSFMFPSSAEFVGEWHLLDIGLNQNFIDRQSCQPRFSTAKEMKTLLKPRKKFSHKGDYGHALLLSGSKGKVGATVIAASACLRSGTGLLTIHAPGCGEQILQTTVPEAMLLNEANNSEIGQIFELDAYNAIGVGPGTGTSDAFTRILENILKGTRSPLVLDADALNVISQDPELKALLPESTILTPHVKEFTRLTRKAENDADRHELQKEFSKKYKVIVVLKGAHTCITCPDGSIYFNSTGNAGMAKGGFGDALTGIITGLLAQKYDPKEAAILGVYLHGLAGDIAKNQKTEYSMTAMDLVNELGEAYRMIAQE